MRNLTSYLAALLLLCSTVASAHSFEVDGVFYSITSSANKTVAVTFSGSSYEAVANEYTGAVVIPATVIYNDITYSVTSIGGSAFSGCSGLTSVTIPNSVTGIGGSAFRNCSGLTSVTIPESVTSIGVEAFYGCFGLKEVHINDISAWCGITYFAISQRSSNPLDYAHNLYLNGEKVTNLVIPDDVTEIKDYAFDGCSGLTSVTIPESVTSIGFYAFNGCSGLKEVHINDISAWCGISFVVEALYNHSSNPLYYAHNIYLNGEKVTNLVIPSDVTEIKDYAFLHCSGLTSVTIGNSVTSIGSSAFSGCSGLTSVTIPNSVTSIGRGVFSGCSGLTSVTIPNSVTSIGGSAFSGCSGLTSVTIPNGVTSIGSSTFSNCSSLNEIKLPPTLQTIGSSAFSACSSLTEVRLPSSVLSVASNAFSGCSAIKDVYTYTIEPTSISESTFSTTVFQNATLHVPTTSYWNYYWDDGWKRFLNLTYFDEPYEYFYLNNDYTLDEETGYIDGTPDVDINAGGGLVVEGETGDTEDVKQELGDVNINHDGNGTSGSIIGDNNVHAENLNIRINIKGNRWYFFAFPFDIPLSKISMEKGTQYVFRYYDGEERAKNGKGGWKDINENHLKAARGYIFQAAADDVLVLNIADVRFKKEDKYNELVEHVTENLQDASWNFTGNPYLSYYDINNLGYDAPITIWNGSSYEAIRPGDDDYHFAPFEAFFVQKPEDKGSVDFEGDHQKTHKKAQAANAANAAKRAGASVATDRKLVNIAISGENAAADRTRVVFNDKQSLAYETACDAVKFESDAAAQLYTLDNKNVRYAINERPVGNGTVPVGVKFANGGRYTISAERMDTAVLLKDEKTGTVHNLAEGAYTFIADAGTDEARFSLVFNGGTTGVDAIASVTDAVVAVDGGVNIENATGAIVEIYTVAGALVASDTVSGYVALPAGAYVININGKSIKVVVK